MTADDEFDPTVPTLDVVVSRLGTTTTIQFVGECDLAQREELQATVRDVFEQRPECVVLDLSRLRFIDSTGIHAVIEVSRRASADGVRLVIVPGMPPVQHVFELCGLAERLPFLPDGGRALGNRQAPQHVD